MHFRSVSIVLVLAGVLALPLSARGQTPADPGEDAPEVTDQQTFSVDGRLLGLSPDGRFLAAYDQDADRLCSFETSDPTQSHACADLASAGVQAIAIDDARWSPDGTRLAFTEPGPVYIVDSDIWVFDADTGDLVDVTDDGVEGGLHVFDDGSEQRPFFMDVLPAWSPDGSEIAFARSGWREGRWYGTHLMRVSADGSDAPTEIVDITSETPMVVYFGSAWSPDGRTLYYTVAMPEVEDPDNGIWEVDLATGQARQLAGVDDPDSGYPAVLAVSPVGDIILVRYPILESSFAASRSFLGLLDVASESITTLEVLSAELADFALPRAAAFSPDGAWLLYSSSGPASQQVYLRPVGGEAETPLLGQIREDDRSAYRLSWASDGTVLMQNDPTGGILLTVEGGDAPLPVATPASAPVDQATPTGDTQSGPIDPATVDAGTHLVVNDAVVVLRSAPSPDAPIAGELKQGTVLAALGPPVSGGGYTWIPVTDPATGTIGYIRAEFVSPADTSRDP